MPGFSVTIHSPGGWVLALSGCLCLRSHFGSGKHPTQPRPFSQQDSSHFRNGRHSHGTSLNICDQGVVRNHHRQLLPGTSLIQKKMSCLLLFSDRYRPLQRTAIEALEMHYSNSLPSDPTGSARMCRSLSGPVGLPIPNRNKGHLGSWHFDGDSLRPFLHRNKSIIVLFRHCLHSFRRRFGQLLRKPPCRSHARQPP